MYSRRIVFAPTIPVSATPEFITSGVSLEWKVRLEFVVPSSSNENVGGHGPHGGGGGGGGGGPRGSQDAEDSEDDGPDTPSGGTKANATPHPLLEEMSRDDKGGLVLVAVENLACESFEVAVPLRIYGAVCTGLERLDRDDALEEGLAV
jgi:RAB6A-GEF complex partner protein 2